MSASSISDNVPLLSLTQTTIIIPPATEYRSPSIQLGYYSALSLHFQASTDCYVAFENSPNGKDWFSDTVNTVFANIVHRSTLNIKYKWIRLYIKNNDPVADTSTLLQAIVYGITAPPSILPTIEKVYQSGALKTVTIPQHRNVSKQVLTSYVFDHGYSGFPLSYPPACPYYYCPPTGSAPVSADPFPANPTPEQRAKAPYADIFFYVAYPEGYVPPIIDHQHITGGPAVTAFPAGLAQKSQAASYTSLNYIAPLPGNPPILERKPYISFEQNSNAMIFSERLNGNTDGPGDDMNRITVMTGIPFHQASASGRVGCYFTASYNQAPKIGATTIVTQMLVGMGDFVDNPLRPLNNIPEDLPPYESIQDGIKWYNNQSPGDSSQVYLYNEPVPDDRRLSPGQTSGAAFGYYSNVTNDQPSRDFRVYFTSDSYLDNHKIIFTPATPSLSFGIAVWNASEAHFYLISAWKFDHADGTGNLPSINFQTKNSFQVEYDPATETYFFYIQDPASEDEDTFTLVHSVSTLPPTSCNFSPLATFGHYNSSESWDDGASSLALHSYTTYHTHPSPGTADPIAPAFKRSFYTINQHIPSKQALAGGGYSNPTPLVAILPDPSASFYPSIYETPINDPSTNIDEVLPKTNTRPIAIASFSFSCSVANTPILVRIVGRRRWNYNVLLHPGEPYKGDGVAQYTVSNLQTWRQILPVRLLVADARHLTFTASNQQPIASAAAEWFVYSEFYLGQGFHSVNKTAQEIAGQPTIELDPRIDTLSVEFACPQAETLSNIAISIGVLY